MLLPRWIALDKLQSLSHGIARSVSRLEETLWTKKLIYSYLLALTRQSTSQSENEGSRLSRPLEYISIPFPTHHLPSEVPILHNIEYDFSGFEDFPTRHGFVKDGTVHLEGKSAADCASLLQSWLFFGLLAEIGGELVNREAFLTRQSTSPREISIRVAGYWNRPKTFTPRSLY